MTPYSRLLKKIKNKNAKIGVIGVGYVGNSVAKEAVSSGYTVLGFTKDRKEATLLSKNPNIKYQISADNNKIKNCDIVVICVPTPIKADKSPDLEPLTSAVNKVRKTLHKGTLIIVESTIAPGTTRNKILPILKKSGLKEEEDFFLAFSPERIDPGNPNFGINNTPKIVAGLGNLSAHLTILFYSSFVKNVVSVSNLETAELSKLIENSYRFINISFINEMLSYSNSLGVNLWEVIDAAATKPFGFMPHYPGPGIGGQCIPVDPYYLLDDAKKRHIKLNILKNAGIVNDNQPKLVVKKAIDILKKINGSSVLIVGLSYKEDVNDTKESPSILIWKYLEENKITVSYFDPYVPQFKGQNSLEIANIKNIKEDLILLVTPHSKINYKKILSFNKPVLDTKNALKRYSHQNIFLL